MGKISDAEVAANLAAAMGEDIGVDDLAPSPRGEKVVESEGEGGEEERPSHELAENEEWPDELGADEDDDQSEDDDSSQDEGSMPYAEKVAIKAALSGDGLPERLIEEMSDSELESFMAARSKRDEAFDRYRAKAEAKPKGKAGADDDDSGEAPDIEPDNSLTSDEYKALVEEFGEDDAKRFSNLVDSKVKGVLSMVEQQAEIAMDQRLAARLEGAVPEGLSPEQFSKVRELAIVLASGGASSELTGLARENAVFDAALRAAIPEALTPEERTRNAKRAATKRKGAPTRPKRGVSANAKTLSKEDAMHKRAMMSAQGKTTAQIDHALGDD